MASQNWIPSLYLSGRKCWLVLSVNQTVPIGAWQACDFIIFTIKTQSCRIPQHYQKRCSWEIHLITTLLKLLRPCSHDSNIVDLTTVNHYAAQHYPPSLSRSLAPYGVNTWITYSSRAATNHDNTQHIQRWRQWLSYLGRLRGQNNHNKRLVTTSQAPWKSTTTAANHVSVDCCQTPINDWIRNLSWAGIYTNKKGRT